MIRTRGLILGVTALVSSVLGLAEAYTFLASQSFTASVTVGGTGGGGLTIVATPLPSQTFFGKNLVIPVKVVSSSGPLDPKTLRVNFTYVLLDANGNPLTPTLTAIPSFVQDPTNPYALLGTVILSPSDLALIRQGGRLQYVFQAINGGAGTLLTASGPQFGTGALTSLPSPFETSIIDSLCQPVGPSGGQISAPDLFQNDGRTSVVLAPGAVSSPGTLCIRQEDTSIWPTGLGGQTPVVVYTITLQDTSLLQTANLILSYPAELNGQILGRNASPNDLGIYWLGPESSPRSAQSWRLLSRSQLDTTKHTVAGVSGHFSTFALFAAGAGSTAASLRPTERIITPNGDGINDSALFTGLTAGDEIRIFDIRGRRVREMSGAVGAWDGKDDSGSVVESGVYIYQYTSLGERVSGVIMVAK